MWCSCTAECGTLRDWPLGISSQGTFGPLATVLMEGFLRGEVTKSVAVIGFPSQDVVLCPILQCVQSPQGTCFLSSPIALCQNLFHLSSAFLIRFITTPAMRVPSLSMPSLFRYLTSLILWLFLATFLQTIYFSFHKRNHKKI